MLTLPQQDQMVGEFRAVRVNTGQKSAIVWTFMDREVWITEVPAIGGRRAMMEFAKLHLDQRTITKVWTLENSAHEALDRIAEQNRLAQEQDEPDECDAEPVGEFVNVFPWG